MDFFNTIFWKVLRFFNFFTKKMSLDSSSWNQRYISENTRWDIGYVSTPLKEYFDQLNENLF